MSREAQSTNSDPWSVPANEWSISSNNGAEHLEMSLLSVIDSRTCLCSVRLRRSFWQRDRPLADAQMTADHDIALSQVVVAVDALRDLREDLRRWRDEGVSFERELAAARVGQHLVLSIGTDAGSVRSIGKAAFGVRYCVGLPMAADWSFVIDQSCVFLAMEGISRVLDSLVRQTDARD